MKSYVVALAVLVGIMGGFYGGYKFGQSNVSANQTTATTRSGSGTGANGQFPGGRTIRGGSACPTPGATPSPGTTAVVFGTITSLGSTSMTIHTTGCDITVSLGTGVSITKQAIGSTSDLQDQLTVTVQGQRQADGSIKASAISINPGGPGGGLRGGPGGNGPPAGAGG